MVRIPGTWQSFDHIEESLTLDELLLLFETAHKVVDQDRKFAASLKGIDLGDSKSESEGSQFDDIQRRAEAELAGKSEDQMNFEDMGFGFAGGDF